MYNHDAAGTRCNPREDKLNPDSVRGLKVKWVFPTAGDVYGTPSVVKTDAVRGRYQRFVLCFVYEFGKGPLAGERG